MIASKKQKVLLTLGKLQGKGGGEMIYIYRNLVVHMTISYNEGEGG